MVAFPLLRILAALLADDLSALCSSLSQGIWTRSLIALELVDVRFCKDRAIAL